MPGRPVRGRVAVLTPTKNTRAEDFDLLEEFWQSLGSVVVQMSPEEHDQALALTSHLPHVAAAALALPCPKQYFRLSRRAACWTRPAWRPAIPNCGGRSCLLNRDNVLTALEQYGAKLSALHAAIRDDNQDEITRFLTLGQEEPRCFGKLTFIAADGPAGPRRHAKWPPPPPNCTWPTIWPSTSAAAT